MAQASCNNIDLAREAYEELRKGLKPTEYKNTIAWKAARLLAQSRGGFIALEQLNTENPPEVFTGTITTRIRQSQALEVFLQTLNVTIQSKTVPFDEFCFATIVQDWAIIVYNNADKPSGEILKGYDGGYYFAWRQGFRSSKKGSDLDIARKRLNKATSTWVERAQIQGYGVKQAVLRLLGKNKTPYRAMMLGAQGVTVSTLEKLNTMTQEERNKTLNNLALKATDPESIKTFVKDVNEKIQYTNSIYFESGHNFGFRNIFGFIAPFGAVIPTFGFRKTKAACVDMGEELYGSEVRFGSDKNKSFIAGVFAFVSTTIIPIFFNGEAESELSQEKAVRIITQSNSSDNEKSHKKEMGEVIDTLYSKNDHPDCFIRLASQYADTETVSFAYEKNTESILSVEASINAGYSFSNTLGLAYAGVGFSSEFSKENQSHDNYGKFRQVVINNKKSSELFFEATAQLLALSFAENSLSIITPFLGASLR